MSTKISPSVNKTYGIERTCSVWNISRSTFYWQKKNGKSIAKRGPQGPHSDEEILVATMEFIKESPFYGEGYRKVHIALRKRGIRTAPKRVMRIMRENKLQVFKPVGNPHGPKAHDGDIKTKHINDMWDTDMTTTLTTKEGNASIFFAIDHCSLELVGIHAARRGTRFEALEPIRQAMERNFGRFGENVACGLTLRHDHGSQFISHVFQDELQYLGIKSSPSYVREPQGNGIAERFVRTLKENLLWIRHFETVEELRLALLGFQETYNNNWLIARHKYKTPAQVKAEQLAGKIKAA